MEISLFDKNGSAVAYISSDGTIYLWDGRPVAYLLENHVYGFNGKHLGWFENGIMYDGDGYRIGFSREKCPVVTQIEPVKSVKHVKSVKSVKSIAPIKPIFSLANSNKKFKEFLLMGY